MNKIYLFASLVVFSFPFMGNAQNCSLKSETKNFSGEPTPTVVTYHYSNDRLTKMTEGYQGQNPIEIDSIFYSVAGRIDSVVSYSPNKSKRGILINQYDGGRLVKQISKFGIFIDTNYYTYNAQAELSKIVTKRYEGTDLDVFETIEVVSMSQGKVTKALYDGQAITLEYDQAPNPFYGLYISNDYLNTFPANNLVKIYADMMPNNPMMSYTYTYADGRVATKTRMDDGNTNETVFAYNCPVTTGTESYSLSNANTAFLYPNPSADGIYYLKSEATIGQIVVRNAQGQSLENIQAMGEGTYKIDLSETAPGLYIVSYEREGRISALKLAK